MIDRERQLLKAPAVLTSLSALPCLTNDINKIL